MAVISVREFAEGRESLRGQPNRMLRRRRFIVRTDYAKTRREEIELAPGLPRVYDFWITPEDGTDTRLRVRTVTPRQRLDSRRVWDVDVEYDSEFERVENPFTEPWEVRIYSDPYDEPLPGRVKPTYNPQTQSPSSQDPAEAGADATRVWGEGIVNSAGAPYDPPATRKASRPMVSVIRNEPFTAFTIAKKVEWENTVNASAWSNIPARQVLLASYSATFHKHVSTTVSVPDVFYWRVEYLFALKAETWDLQLPDVGSYYIDYEPDPPVKVAFTAEGTGEPRLGFLDNRDNLQPGKKLADGDPVQWNRWRVYREKSFAALGVSPGFVAITLAFTQSQIRERPR